MTDVNLAASAVAASDVAAVQGTKKARKPSVSAATYLAALKAGSAAEPKKTAQQVADELGMEKTSFDQRLNQYRQDWLEYGFILKVKGGATAETLGMSTEDFDAKVQKSKDNGNFDAFTFSPELLATYDKPFPWTLADGRSNRDGESTKGATARNAILAAMLDV
jgi:hypothetical protein